MKNLQVENYNYEQWLNKEMQIEHDETIPEEI